MSVLIWIQTVIVFLKEFFQKINIEKRYEKLSSMQRVKTSNGILLARIRDFGTYCIMQSSKAQMSLHISTVLPDPSLFAHTN